MNLIINNYLSSTTWEQNIEYIDARLYDSKSAFAVPWNRGL